MTRPLRIQFHGAFSHATAPRNAREDIIRGGRDPERGWPANC
jgi:hypothetical protein